MIKFILQHSKWQDTTRENLYELQYNYKIKSSFYTFSFMDDKRYILNSKKVLVCLQMISDKMSNCL